MLMRFFHFIDTLRLGGRAVRLSAVLAIAMGAAGCEQLEYLPYAAHIDTPTHVNDRSIARIQEMGLRLPVTFAVVSDTQGGWDELDEALASIRSRDDVSFIIHAGDLTDFGLPKEYEWTTTRMERCGLPYITVIGNHDCLGNGDETYDYIFGPQNFSFNVANIHIVGLNTVALEYDYSHPVPDLGFIEADANAVQALNEEAPGSITHTIVVMHSRPYDEQFNNNVAKPFNYYLEHYPGMKADATRTDEEGRERPFCSRGLCINGHNHQLAVTDLFGNGVLYYQCPNILKRCYLVFTITEEGYEYEAVDF